MADISVRNLQEGFDSPLKKFKGKFDSYSDEPATGYEGTRVNLNFTSIEVFQSSEPYNFPIAVINMGLSNKKKSKWGYFGTSLTALMPDTEDLKNQVGKILGLVFADGKDGRPDSKPIYNRDAGGEVPTPVWLVYEVEGVTTAGAGKTTQDIAREVLDGKTLAQFNQEVLQKSEVQKDTKFQRAILDKSFVNALAQTGEFTVDSNGVYHKKA